MKKITIVGLLAFLVGCSAPKSNTDVSSLYTVPISYQKITADKNDTALETRDIDAINAAIAQDRNRYWAPQEEVMQQEMAGSLL